MSDGHRQRCVSLCEDDEVEGPNILTVVERDPAAADFLISIFMAALNSYAALPLPPLFFLSSLKTAAACYRPMFCTLNRLMYLMITCCHSHADTITPHHTVPHHTKITLFHTSRPNKNTYVAKISVNNTSKTIPKAVSERPSPGSSRTRRQRRIQRFR